MQLPGGSTSIVSVGPFSIGGDKEAGLIHMSRNTTDEIDYTCNCDRWHCAVVGQILKQPRPGIVSTGRSNHPAAGVHR